MQIWRHVTDLAPDSYTVTLNAQPTSPQSQISPNSRIYQRTFTATETIRVQCNIVSPSFLEGDWHPTSLVVLWVPCTVIRFKAIGSWSLSASKVARCLYVSRLYLHWALIYVPACIWTVHVRQSWWQQSAQSHTDCILQVDTLHINSTLIHECSQSNRLYCIC